MDRFSIYFQNIGIGIQILVSTFISMKKPKNIQQIARLEYRYIKFHCYMLMDWHLQALQTISLMKSFFQILELFFE